MDPNILDNIEIDFSKGFQDGVIKGTKISNGITTQLTDYISKLYLIQILNDLNLKIVNNGDQTFKYNTTQYNIVKQEQLIECKNYTMFTFDPAIITFKGLKTTKFKQFNGKYQVFKESPKIIEPKPKFEIPADMIKQLGNCVVDYLLEQKYFPIKVVGMGLQGIVVQLCRDDQCELVIKVRWRPNGKISSEPMIATKAGEVGIGPKIHHFDICSYKDNGKIIWIEYMIMDKLSGPTLDQKYPYQPDDIEEALDLYYQLLQKHNIMQLDAKGNNFMFDQGKLYLIDYGISRKLKHKEKRSVSVHMRIITRLLLNTLLSKGSEAGTVDLWRKDTIVNKINQFIIITDAANKWMKRHFGKNVEPIIPSTGILLRRDLTFLDDDDDDDDNEEGETEAEARKRLIQWINSQSEFPLNV